jgi:uncharacterized membrane protein YcaP (DUF421 family)
VSTIVHAVIGYFFLMLVVRVLSRRPGAQMTLFEFVIVFLIGGIAILSTVGHDRSVTNCTCAVITVGLLHRSVSWAKLRFPAFGRVTDGTPLLLWNKGQWQEEAMHGMRIAPEDVSAAARTKGLKSVDEADYAILERNGGISIIEKEEE